MEIVKKGIVLPLGGVGEVDENILGDPTAIKLDGRTFVYWAGKGADNHRVCGASTEDGVHFTRYGVVIPNGPAGSFDDTRCQSPKATLVDGRVHVYYNGNPGSGQRVGLGISKDGFNFTKLGVVVPHGAVGEYDDARVSGSCITKVDGRSWVHYSAGGASNRVGSGVSKNGINFTKYGVSIPLGDPGDLDDSHAQGPDIVLKDGVLRATYTAKSPTVRIGLAIAKDPLRYVKLGVAFPLGGIGECDEDKAGNASRIYCDGNTLAFYQAKQTSERLGLVISILGY